VKMILFNFVVVLAGVALGMGASGYLLFARYNRHDAVVRYFAWAGIGLAVSQNEFDENSKDARQVLLNTLTYFERGLQSSKIDPPMKKAIRMESGLTEARVSVLESEAGHADQAKSYMSRAQDDLKAVGWVDSSDANILRAVKREPATR
jgi:hypothetical protein